MATPKPPKYKRQLYNDFKAGMSIEELMVKYDRGMFKVNLIIEQQKAKENS